LYLFIIRFGYRKETPANRRKLARQWGVVYVSRPGEEPDEEVVVEELFRRLTNKTRGCSGGQPFVFG